jgi:hypothetical protein
LRRIDLGEKSKKSVFRPFDQLVFGQLFCRDHIRHFALEPPMMLDAFAQLVPSLTRSQNQDLIHCPEMMHHLLIEMSQHLVAVGIKMVLQPTPAVGVRASVRQELFFSGEIIANKRD